MTSLERIEKALGEIEKRAHSVSWETREYCFDGKALITHGIPKLIAALRIAAEGIEIDIVDARWVYMECIADALEGKAE